jgi:hypothetical protein
MFETNQFKLPLLQASQAQKHVTVNEAIARLDAVAQLRIETLTATVPPQVGVDGETYWVASGATGAWFGMDGQLSIYSNGAWVFLNPKEGWSAWIVDMAKEFRFVAGTWLEITTGGGAGGATLTGPLGSSFEMDMIEFEHTITAGSSNSSSIGIPAGSMVAMVAFRVSESIVTDGPTDWRLGISNSVTRYGSGYGLGLNVSDVGGENKTMFYYPSAKNLYLSVTGGNFVSGKVIFSIYCLKFGLPAPI